MKIFSKKFLTYFWQPSRFALAYLSVFSAKMVEKQRKFTIFGNIGCTLTFFAITPVLLGIFSKVLKRRLDSAHLIRPYFFLKNFKISQKSILVRKFSGKITIFGKTGSKRGISRIFFEIFFILKHSPDLKYTACSFGFSIFGPVFAYKRHRQTNKQTEICALYIRLAAARRRPCPFGAD